MRMSEAFPSNYLKAADLQGRRINVTIDHVAVEEVGRQKDRKPIVYFQGKDKGLVLNKTNGNKISAIAGTDEMDEWGGVAVQLFPTMVDFGGEEVEAIRVAAIKPGSQKPAPKPEPAPLPTAAEFQAQDDDVPF